MIVPRFAAPPPEVVLASQFGFLFVVVIVALFVKAMRTRGISKQNRRFGLGQIAILYGPVVGAFLAWAADALGHVRPADVGNTYAVFIVIGGVAGLIGGITFGMTSLLTPPHSEAKAGLTKPVGAMDEL